MPPRQTEKLSPPDVSGSSSGLAVAARKPYQQPALRAYGSLVDLTRFGGSQILDSGIGSLRNP